MSSLSPPKGNGYWDHPRVFFELIRFGGLRFLFRVRRTAARMLSPKRLIASSLAVLFLALYGVSGVMIFATRQPADSEHLRLWMSGGMVLYTIYHATKLAWQDKISALNLSDAEQQWISGSPLRRSSVAIYAVLKILPATLLKSCLLATVLIVDVRHPLLLVPAIFLSLMLLEIARLTLVRIAAAMSDRRRSWFRMIATSIAIATAIQILMRVIATVPWGASAPAYLGATFAAMGQTASSDAVQLFSLPWHPMVNLSVANTIDVWTMIWLGLSVATLPLAIVHFVWVDGICVKTEQNDERRRLGDGNYRRSDDTLRANTEIAGENPLERYLGPLMLVDADAAMVARRAAKTVYQYQGSILLSFLIPVALCLSPLLAHSINHTWIFIVGGITMCTSLLAPSALKIDFRRDLSRMLILRSLPIRPVSMVLGQLYFPVLITSVFQWVVLLMAAAVLQPGWDKLLLWGGTLTAFSVFTFAVENALFLAYPHLESNQGIGMVIRTKLTFLGKSCLILFGFIALAAWIVLCHQHLPGPLVAFAQLAGALLFTWAMAAVAIASAAWCWKRFDVSSQSMMG